jgi:hypothetical protein
MALSPAHEVVGLVVYQRAGDEPISMATVHDVLARLAAHPSDCSCGSCLWVGKADPVKTWRAALSWQRQAAAAARLARISTHLARSSDSHTTSDTLVGMPFSSV